MSLPLLLQILIPVQRQRYLSSHTESKTVSGREAFRDTLADAISARAGITCTHTQTIASTYAIPDSSTITLTVKDTSTVTDTGAHSITQTTADTGSDTITDGGTLTERGTMTHKGIDTNTANQKQSP